MANERIPLEDLVVAGEWIDFHLTTPGERRLGQIQATLEVHDDLQNFYAYSGDRIDLVLFGWQFSAIVVQDVTCYGHEGRRLLFQSNGSAKWMGDAAA